MKLPKWNIKETMFLLAWAKLKIPVLAFVGPRVVELTDQRTQILIPLNRRTRNHLDCMYFGVLSVGADIAGGLIAFRLLRNHQDHKVAVIFKDFKANFLKRAEGDTVFTCSDGKKLQKLVEQTIATGERVEDKVHVVATCPNELGETPVAKFTLTISLKKK